MMIGVSLISRATICPDHKIIQFKQGKCSYHFLFDLTKYSRLLLFSGRFLNDPDSIWLLVTLTKYPSNCAWSLRSRKRLLKILPLYQIAFPSSTSFWFLIAFPLEVQLYWSARAKQADSISMRFAFFSISSNLNQLDFEEWNPGTFERC